MQRTTVGLIVLLALGVPVAPLAATAQPTGKMSRLGVLMLGPRTPGGGPDAFLPGGNIMGLTSLGVELSRKRLELLKEVVPPGSRVAALGNRANPANLLNVQEAENRGTYAGIDS